MADYIALPSPSSDFGFSAPPLLLTNQLRSGPMLADQLLAAAIAFVRSTFPAFSNSFFTMENKSLNFGATTEDSQGILRVVQAQAAAITYLTSGWKRYLLDRNAPSDVDAISETISNVFEAVVQLGPGAIDLSEIDAQQV